MVKIGENLSSDLSIFKYPSREPLLLEGFISVRPEVLDFYVYDVCLTSGQFLYASKGGIGITKERYIVDMHKAISNQSFADCVYEMYDAMGIMTKTKYIRLRESFNESDKFCLSLKQSATLYILWHFSRYAHRYRGNGYDALYIPSNRFPAYENIKSQSILSRKKNLIFRKEDPYTMAESLLHDGVVAYMHIPRSYGEYGANFSWTEKRLKDVCSVFNELSQLGHKVCISETLSVYGLERSFIAKYLPGLSQTTVSGFKGSELTSNPHISEAYFTNF